jgi:hypothetical protein
MATQPQLPIAASVPPRDSSNERGEASARSNLFVPPIPNAHLEALLADIDQAEARRAAIHAEAMESLQPYRYETWAMLAIVIWLLIYAVAG